MVEITRYATNYRDRLVTLTGKVTNPKGEVLKPVGNGYIYVVSKDGTRTRRTVMHLVLDAWYNVEIGIQIEEGNDYSQSNVVTFDEPDTVVTHNGLRWAHISRLKSIICEDGRAYHQNNHRLTQHMRGNVLLYSIDKMLFKHSTMMLEAFQYMTSTIMFDCDESKPLSLQEIIYSYNPNKKLKPKQREKHMQHLITIDEYYKMGEVSFPVEITVDMVIGEFRGVKVTKCGLIVDENNPKQSVPYQLTQRVPTYKGVPIKFYVYNAFVIGNKQHNNRKIICLDGNDSNTSFNNLKSK